MRVISMCWVIMGHTIQFGTSLSTSNAYMYGEVVTRSSMSIVLQALFSVDTFFFLSGLLASHLLLLELRKKGHINWLMYYVHRFLRLTPIYMFWFDMMTIPPIDLLVVVDQLFPICEIGYSLIGN
jgi:peptidoglycan/LPS O-acetylase OafA/YrhL